MKKNTFVKVLNLLWPRSIAKNANSRCGICELLHENYKSDGLFSKRNIKLIIHGMCFAFANTCLLPLSLVLRLFRFRILTGTTFFQIGEVILLDAVIKKNLLKKNKEKFIFLYCEDLYDNKYLINLYASHLFLVKNKFLLLFYLLLSYSILLKKNVVDLDTNCEVCELIDVLNKYRQHYQSPIIKIPQSDINTCKSLLKNLIGNKKWVCIHARESGYKSNIYRDKNRTTRNADIRSYKKAIEHLVAHNYIAVRMGDKSMSTIDEFKDEFGSNYFDYAHSKLKSDLMDAYLFSHCEFSIVCSSGPSEIPSIFNRNILTVNGYTAVNSLRFYERDVAIFKKIQNIKNGKYLNIHKLFQPPFDRPLQREVIHSLGYQLVDNDEDEIFEAVKFFLSGFSCDVDVEINPNFKPAILRNHFCWGSEARYSPHFIRKYIENQEHANYESI